MRLVYGAADADHAHIGDLQQNSQIGVHIDIDNLVSRHFAIVGATGVGKSSGVAIILQKILDTRPNLRIFLVDPHNEYGRCFGDKAQVLTPRNLRLPFWLFNFEETVDAFFGGRPGIDEEIEILSEVIPLAKAAYLQYRVNNEHPLAKKRNPRDTGFTADTPVPYRIEDLINLLDERMGKLENRNSRMVYHKLIGRIQTFRNHPRYAFMFENANIGGDTMAEILAQLFRLPTRRQADDHHAARRFPGRGGRTRWCRCSAAWRSISGCGATAWRRCCSSARRRTATRRPTRHIGFGPTKRALSRIAKEGRKYGVFLGLVTQRPAEIDPTIISQCSTLFVMRLSNDRDQELIRSAVSDAAVNLLSFIPSLGTREVFTFGPGVALPTRMRFKELPPELRPNSEAIRQHPLRCRHQYQPRSALLGDRALAQRQHEPSQRRRRIRRLQFAARCRRRCSRRRRMPVPPSPRGEALRSSLLKKPLEASSFGNPQARKPAAPAAAVSLSQAVVKSGYRG